MSTHQHFQLHVTIHVKRFRARIQNQHTEMQNISRLVKCLIRLHQNRETFFVQLQSALVAEGNTCYSFGNQTISDDIMVAPDTLEKFTEIIQQLGLERRVMVDDVQK